MRGHTVRTPERVAQAQALRAQGLTYREIGARLGVSHKTANEWVCDPDKSKRLARIAAYAGTCQVCGGPTSGCDGPGTATDFCLSCRAWTEQEVIDAMRRWADEHGGIPPTVLDWRRARDGYPQAHIAVIRRLGWNELLLRAGFSLRCDRRPETQEWIEDQIRAGRSATSVAEVLGVSCAAITNRLRTRGLSVRSLQGRAAA